MASEVDSTTLIWLLEEFATMQRRLRDERIVVLPAEPIRTSRQRTGDDANSLELRPRVGNGLFIDRKGLSKEFIRHIFVLTLARHLSTRYKQSEDQIRDARC